MPEFIERDVRRMCDSSSSEQTTLLVGCHGDRDELADAVRELGGRVHDYIGRTTLRVSVAKSAVGELCDADEIASIERDKDDVVPQEPGDFRSRTRSTM